MVNDKTFQKIQASVVQTADTAIQSGITPSILGIVIGFPNTYPLDSRVIYRVDSAIQHLANWYQTFISCFVWHN